MDNRSLSQKSLMVRAGLVVFGLLTLGMFVLTLISDRGLLEVRRKAERLTALEEEIAGLEEENADLAREIQDLQSDPAAIERLAREELKMVRPGEVILILPSEPEPDVAP